MNPTQFSWVLASHQPGQLRLFYEALLNRKAQQGFSDQHWTLSLAEGVAMEIYRPSRSRPFPDRGRCLSICLRLDASQVPLEQLNRLMPELRRIGADVVEAPRLESFGAECWLQDPEGNNCLIVVPLASTATRTGG